MISRNLCIIFLNLFAISGFASSPKEDPIPQEVFFGNPEKTSPKISPDGTKLAYLAPDQNNVLNVWIKSLNEETDATLVTSDKKRGIQSFSWEYDGMHILYGQDKDGDENWHLYQTNIQTKTTRDLTPFDGVTASIVAYLPEFPKKLLVALNIQNPALFDVYQINLQNGAVELQVENKSNVTDWVADNNLNVRGCSFYDQEGGIVIQTQDKDSSWKDLLHFSSDDNGGMVCFSPDNQSLYVCSDLESNTAKLVKIDLETGKKEIVAEDPNFDLQGEVLIHPTSHQVEAISILRERLEWIALDPAIKQDLTFLQKKKKELRIVSRDLKNERWIVMYSSDKSPPHFYLYDRMKKENTFLFSANTQLEKYSLAEMEPITFAARDGMKLHGYLSLPVKGPSKNLPTILLVHGGPWVRDTWGYNSYVQWLVSRGYAVLQVNYRGSTGYGKKYLAAGYREWAGKMHSDLLDGKEWLIQKGIANPNKVGIFGGSYGGYATLVGLTFTPEAFCCGVDIVGPSNLITLLQTFPPYWSPAKSLFTKRLGNIDTEKEFLESRSPLFKADKICKPLLIAQGANDPRVKQAESDQIVSAMRKNGQEVEYMLFPDEGHGFKRPENRLKFIASAEEFLAKYLKGDSK